jgi:hypothetical protein
MQPNASPQPAQQDQQGIQEAPGPAQTLPRQQAQPATTPQ